MTNEHSIKKLREEITAFVADRDWQQFHSPKNLTMALSVEVAELAEIFQWQSEKESYLPDNRTLSKIEEEIGDVMIYLTTLSLKFGINPVEAALKKMILNRQKYPADRVKGKSDKYDTYSK